MMLRRSFIQGVAALFGGLVAKPVSQVVAAPVKVAKNTIVRGAGPVIQSSTTIVKGDLVWLDAMGKYRSARDFVWDTDLAKTQAGFAQQFAGVYVGNNQIDVGNSVYVEVPERNLG